MQTATSQQTKIVPNVLNISPSIIQMMQVLLNVPQLKSNGHTCLNTDGREDSMLLVVSLKLHTFYRENKQKADTNLF